MIWCCVLIFFAGSFHSVQSTPTFTAPSPVSISESTGVGASVATVSATDPGPGTITYSIQSQTPAPKFTIDASTGVITTSGALDFETVASYTLTIRFLASSDTSTADTTLVISITDVNDNTPVFSPNIYYATVTENSTPGTSVALVTVTDADVGDNITVFILSGDDAANKFTVNVKTIQTSNTAVDYDVLTGSNYRYTLVIVASDPIHTGTATVYVTVTNVNEHTPVWGTFSPAYTSATTPYNMAENSPIGTTIVTVTATDADAGVDGQIMYSLGTVTSSASTTVTGLFHVDQVSGIITTTSSSFDRDPSTGGVAYYDVVVKAVDQGLSPKSAERTVRVGLLDVNDNTPTFSQNVYTVSIAETTLASTSILTLTATDNDLTSTLSYSIEPSSTPSTYATYFEMDATNAGRLNLKAVADLDSGVDTTFNLVIKVADAVTSPRTSTAKVTVSITYANEFDPVFQPDVTVNKNEDAAIGVSVATITATDNDRGEDGKITYSISGGNADGKFTINPTTGEILLAKKVDYESHTTYILTIVATDGGSVARTDTASVTVSLNDISDEEPTCTTNVLSATVNEPGTVNANVVKLSCTDRDAIDTLSYTIASGDPTSKFSVDNTGQIKLAATLDYDSGVTSYSLLVEVSDGTTTLEIPVNIAVGAVNEFTPTFGATTSVTFAENTAVGMSLLTFPASDGDASPHNIKRYSITAVTNSGLSWFVIDSATAEIKLAKPLDYETATSYVITLTAVDGGTPALTGTGSVTIQVSNVNDVTPSCTPAAHVITVAENTATATDVIASFGCTDSDGPNLTYTITSQSPSNNFILNGSPPSLRLNTALNYETASSFELEVTVSDGTLSTVVYVDVAVTDVNDGPPTFSSTTYTTTVVESASIGQSVATYTASDPDLSTSTFGKLQYSILSGNADKKFTINPNSGKISVAGVLNADVTPSYTLVIQAIEASGVNSATATVSITVNGVNDNAPTCSSDLAFSVTKAEPGTVNDVIFPLTCTDVDGDTLTYTMTSGDSTYFQMSGSNLQLKAAIDYDTVANTQFDFVIRVSDGTNNLDVTGTLVLTGINEFTPTFSQTTYSVTKVESTTPGSQMTVVTATDTDKGETVSYTWVTATTAFTLDRTSGEILLAATLDRETTPNYSLLVQASDGTRVATATVTITVTDVNDNTPVFNPVKYSYLVSELDPAGITVARMTATDADDPATNNYGTITYSIVDGNTANRFNIDTSIGNITTAVALDYETATMYTLYVRAIDSGGGAGARSSTAVVTVNVDPENEADPAFSSSSYSATLAENEAVGFSILRVVATDADHGNDGLVYYTMTTHANFYLDRDTGEIFLKASLDYESTTTYTFNVVAHDSGTPPRSATVAVTITITDVNDNTPTCVPNLNALVYAENYASGNTVATLTCTDNDHTSPNNALSYAIVSVNGGVSATPFAVSGVGVVTLAAGQSFNYETTKSYSVLIRVSDAGSPSRSTTATVQVDVTDYNENSPVFSTGTSFTLSETTAVATSVFKVSATDADTSQNVTYYFDPQNAYFGIDTKSGDIILTSTLNFETLTPNPFNIIAVAKDDGTNPSARSTSVTIAVTVLDSNDVTPVFLPAVYATSISENDNVGKTVTTVTATDSDDLTVTYSLVNAYSVFTVDTNGVITIQNKAQNYEATKSYTLVVYAVDAASHTGSTTVYVQVTGYNEFPPVFSPASLSISLAENSAAGTTVADTNATDADDGLDGVLTYTISSQPAGFQNVLAIDPSTGIVTVAANIDREAVASNPLSFTIRATDSGTSPGTQSGTLSLSLTITDVNDNTPVCTKSLYSASISEDAAVSTSVATVVCTDADIEAPNNVLTYSVVSGNDGNFVINAASGVLSVKSTTPTLDRETTPTYQLLIRVADGGTSSLSATTTLTVSLIDVNDNSPVFGPTIYTFALDEDNGVGTSIGTVTATDADTGSAGSFTYSIFAGNTDSNLAIDGNTGEIKLVGALNYETRTTYTLVVHAVDKMATVRTGTGTVTVNVNDVNDVTPSCSPALQTFQIPENTVAFTTVGTIACTDPEAGVNGAVSYVISTVDGIATTSPFQIGASTGVLSLATASLDYESDKLLIVVVHAIDGGSPARTGTATVNVIVTDINEHTPTFVSTPYSQNVIETTSIGASIFKVTATDADTANNVTFSISPTSTVFDIDPVTGVIYLISSLDYEGTQTYQIPVRAVDNGTPSKTGTATVTINVINANDVKPIFNPAVYTAVISENDPVGTTVTTVTAVDSDSGTISYLILSGNVGSVFRIEASGVIVIDLVTNLNYDSATKSYSLVVQASDGTNTGTATVAVAVSNYNDNSPVFASTSSTQTLAENTASGTNVVTVTATDADHGTDGEIKYSITAGNAAGRYAINPSTGAVTLVGSLDMESTQTYTITITATDGGTNPGARTATYILTVQVSDINDVTPICTSSLYSVTVSESVGTGTSVAQLTCSDSDFSAPNNVIVVYTIVSGNTNSDFVVSNSGEVTTANTLNREVTSGYTLVIRVIDSGTTPLTTTTTLTIHVSDVNDVTPTFGSNPYHMSVSESSAIGTTVGTVSASDTDLSSAGKVTYVITSGNPDNVFGVDSSSGAVKVVDTLDFETASTNPYVLVVEGRDGGTPSLTGTTTVSLTVTDANDNTPTCSPTLETVQVNESISGSTSIAHLTCTDADSGANALLSYIVYSVNGITASTLFAVDATGDVTTAAATTLNYETTNAYTILIRVRDGGTPSLSFTATVKVDVMDVNEAAPVFQSTPYTHNVAENTAIGTNVYTVTATDSDGTASITYKINPTNTYFEIDPTSGRIYTISNINYDSLAVKTISLTVEATDNGTPARTATTSVVITVLNVNDGIPTFNPGVYSASVSETAVVGVTVTTVNVTDIDDTSFTFSFASGNTDNVFRIESTGAVIVNDVTKLDYDTGAQNFVLVARAVDSGGNTATATVAVTVTNVNEHTPSYAATSNNVNIAENAAIGTSVDDINAMDADAGQDGVITYSISSISNSGGGLFTINPTSGLISTSGTFDRETQSQYVITALATDGGINPSARTATYSLTVTITDVNDVTPNCTKTLYTASVSEDAGLMTSVAQITCSDADATSPNNVITSYTIVSGNTGSVFTILGTGQVQLFGTLDRETLDNYQLAIRVTDNGTPALSATVTLSVTVSDANDHTPSFVASPYNSNQREDIAVGTTVQTVIATDGDIGNYGTIRYSIASGDVNSKFTIDSVSGAIILTDYLDFETATSNPYTLVIHAVDGDIVSPRTGTGTVIFTILDANDNSPTCSPLLNSVSKAEDASLPSTLLTLNCSDVDSGTNAALTYTLISVNGAAPTGQFSVDTSGAVRLVTALDYETIKQYTILIRVADGGTPSKSVTATVNLEVTDVNDHTPTFTGTPYSKNVREDTAVGSSVFQVNATDGDTDDKVVYSLKSAMANFDVDQKTGNVIVKAPLNYETATNPYEVIVVATDDGSNPGPKSASATVTITVTNFNDGTPEFSPGVYAVSLSENAANGFTVLIVTVVDVDSSAFTYNINSGNSDNIFTISGTTGTGYITVVDNTNLDYESTDKSYLLVISATDNGGLSGTATVNINITPYNEHTPSFVPSSSTQSVAENAALGTVVYDIDATDGDHGNDGVLVYSIASGASGKFAINPTSGVVTVSGSLDRETTSSYIVLVRATDTGTTPGALTATYTLTITVTDVNDVTPVCSSSLYSASLAENAVIGTTVAQLTCSDADATSPNNVIGTYTIFSGNAGGEFLISNTGEVTTAVTFDRETLASYQLGIRVADNGTSALTTTTTLTITITDVNDNDPTFSLNVYNFNQNENIAIGTTVGTVTATDADIGLAGSISYSIFSGNAAGKFAIDKSAGNLKLVSSLDYETITSYTLIIHAIDKEATFRTGTATVSVTVNAVNDNTPVCSAALVTGTVSENAVMSTYVATVACSDADVAVGNTISYSIESGHTEFVIDSSSGVMTTNAIFDIETTPSYDVIVKASDGTFSTNVTVRVTLTDVNDRTPAFSPSGPYTKSIQENIAIGSTIYDVNATDADVTPTNYIFSITAGNSAGKFKIGTSSGIIQTQTTIDRDSPLVTSYTLTIQVSDGTNTASTSIVITITDENDNYPSCDAQTYDVTTSESTVTGTNLISPVCSDLDVSASPTLVYSFGTGNSEGKFQINSGTGVLTLQNTLDYETTTQYTLTVLVNDQGSPAKTTTLTMIVYVGPVNEYTPIFQGTPYTSSVDENTVSGYQVVRISATDSDTGSTHGDIRYAITSGNAAGRFSIDPATGWIQVSGPLDRETTASYSLTVTAADMRSGDATARTASNVFVITINDINDNYPVINPSSYATVINENLPTGGNVIQVSATDADSGIAGTAGLRYSITNGNTGNPFSIDASTGWITLSGNVDANTLSVYILTVQVADQGTPVRSSSTIVTIEVVAVNDHAPTFSVVGTTVTLSESETVGNSIYQAAGSDLDTGTFAVLRYFIKSGNTGNAFTIDLFDGTVRVANKLNYDTPPTTYNLVIIVHDTAQNTTSTRTATMTLTVSLTDYNDITPVFSSNTYTTTLDENVGVGTSVITVLATDGDTGLNGAVTYSIVTGTGASNFTINANSGVISTNTNIDYESLTSYDLVIRATDGGTPSLSSSCVVRITIVDYNDNTPVFQVNNVAVAVSETTPITTTVATARATDADSAYNNNNVIQYAISPTSNKFTIDVTSGAITVTNMLDRETTPSHTLTILAIDQGTLVKRTATATYTIVITDENDNNPSVSGSYDKTIAEDVVVNTIVFNITATDADEYENSVLTYTITNGNTNGDFHIDAGSGLIQVKNTLDRERTSEYFLEVTIRDNGATPRTTTATATVTIGDVNDNAPVFQPSPITSYNFSVAENVAIGTSVNRVNATDADTGVNAAVTYTVAYTITGIITHFTLNTASGVITTAAVLDRETLDTYIFVVRASDGGANTLTSTATVTITITDFNDNIPAFSRSLYTATVVENQPAETSILTVAVTDIDINLNHDIILSIADPTSSLYIGANSSNFILYVKSPIDRETYQNFSFVLTATDQGTPPLSFTTSVVITVGDQNDNRPVFSPTFYNSEIAYNDDCQTTVTTISATDLDDGVNAAFTYAFTLNSYPHLFTLDSNTGNIKLIAHADTNTGYKVYASATDSGSPKLTSSTGATVRIDTYTPADVVLNYYMNISKTSYLAMETTFLSQLSTVYQHTYNKTLARRWCVISRTASSCTVRVYVIKNSNDTDEIGEINTDKEYLTKDEAYAITAADDKGTPAGVIIGIAWSSFVITKVEKFAPDPEEVVATPWIKTTAGIVTVSVLSALLFVLLVVVIVVAAYKMRSPTSGAKNRVDATDDEGDKVAKKQYHSQNNTIRRHSKRNMISADDLKPYDKNHLPPPVVALPMPTATKRVPMQIGNKSLEKPIDINLFNPDMDGPTLIKKPEKLRPGSPVQTENVLSRRKLSPIRRPPAPKPPKPESLYDDFPTDNSNYMVLNREFDGRAIDPVTGRLYEYNTRTNERRWVNTPDGQHVKQLTKDA